VLWDGGRPAGESSCVSCGHCVTVCPCNALMEKSMLGKAGPLTGIPDAAKRAMIEMVKEMEHTTGFHAINRYSTMDAAMREHEIRRTKTVCTYCGVGCSFDVWTRHRYLLKIQPDPVGPANAISTCVKGKFGWDYVNSPERLTRPLIRENGRFREADWDEAYRLVARRLREIEERYGSESLAFVSSSKVSNEENNLMQKLARAVFGTNNVDNCMRYCQNPATEGLQRTVGFGADSGSIADLAKADLLVIVGSNTADSHSVIAARMKAAKKLHGQRWIVADLRRNEMAARADLHLRPRAAPTSCGCAPWRATSSTTATRTARSSSAGCTISTSIAPRSSPSPWSTPRRSPGSRGRTWSARGR
jgi:formate dehydrogenase major subunit